MAAVELAKKSHTHDATGLSGVDLDDLNDVTITTVANDDFVQRKSGVWVNRTVAQVRTDLSDVVYVAHGGTAGTARPSGAISVKWVGSVEPTNATTADEWWDTTNGILKHKASGSFVASGSAAYVAATDVAAPTQLIPAASVMTNASVTGWVAANRAQFVRLHVPRTETYRYIRMSIGTASGNIQVGVVRIDSYHANGVPNAYTRVMDSGVIACPTAAVIVRVDCGATELSPGDHMLFCWANNTTVTIPYTTTDRAQAMVVGHYKTSLASGVPSSGATEGANPTTVTLSGFALEGDI